MATISPTTVHVTPDQLFPIFKQLISRHLLKHLMAESGITCYWRVLTPLVVLWCLILQRLQPDHTTDASVTYLHTGAADALDPADRHSLPLSARIRSESTSAYVQARSRLPLALLTQLTTHLCARASSGLPAVERTWHGRAVRLLDGTTFRARPFGDLAATYGHATNQRGASYWVTIRSVIACCLHTRMAVAYAVGATHTGEVALVQPIMAQDTPGSVFVADRLFGAYRFVQVAHALQMEVVVRLQDQRARALLAWTSDEQLRPGLDLPLTWVPQPRTVVEPGLPIRPVRGRLVVVRLEQAGLRPKDVYLWTSLLDATSYPSAELAALYAQRWQAELNYRTIKTTLEMEEFAVHSEALVQTELAVGILTYNLICAVMLQAAVQGKVPLARLSFVRCLRRIRNVLRLGLPAWVLTQGNGGTYLLDRLAQCQLAVQAKKVQHEPRKVRRRPEVFPALIGDRAVARQQIIAAWALSDKS